jgi:integrase
MASIHEKKGSPYWYAHWRDAKGKPFSKSTGVVREPDDSAMTKENREAAQKIADDFEQRSRDGVPVEPSATPVTTASALPSFRPFARGWIAYAGGDAKYHAKLERYFDHTFEFMGNKADLAIHLLRQADFAGLPSFLAGKGYSHSSINQHIQAVRASFLAAEKKGFVVVSPISTDDYLKDVQPRHAPVAFTIPQIQLLANTGELIDNRTLVLFGYYCAMDIVEAANRVFDDIDFTAKTISWNCRSNGSDMIIMPLHPVLARHLGRLKALGLSSRITPKYFGANDSTLRAHFRSLIEDARIKPGASTSPLNRRYRDLQFSSLKIAFARDTGHQGLFRLARFIRGLSASQLSEKINALPPLKLKPLPLLGDADGN